MVMPFNADEVLEMAERIERNGSRFYRAAAEKFPALRDTLLELATMEDEHEAIFADMRAQLSKSEKEQLVFDPDAEVQMYLHAMADGHVFNVKDDPVKHLANKECAEDVLRAAIDVERDSIVFYVGLKESVSHKAGKEKIEAIIKEEISHIATLNKKLSALK